MVKDTLSGFFDSSLVALLPRSRSGGQGLRVLYAAMNGRLPPSMTLKRHAVVAVDAAFCRLGRRFWRNRAISDNAPSKAQRPPAAAMRVRSGSFLTPAITRKLTNRSAPTA